MWVKDLIARKRQGEELSQEEIELLVASYTRGEVPDYQMSALLMAIYFQGMSPAETAALTGAMARSGEMLDLSAVAPRVVDKHSTGGVGDKATLVVAPLVAAYGVPVAKLSGRGLGFTFGTADKLECFPGLRVALSRQEFLAQLASHGLVLASSSADLAPADSRIYALRDATATVDCVPLIASSVMSKKLAAGAHRIVLDVKVGRGAFMKDLASAESLAQTMVDIGRRAGREVSAVISDMNQPLGRAVGHALEVREALEALSGGGPPDLRDLVLTLATLMAGGDSQPDHGEVRSRLELLLKSGAALAKLAEMVEAQGGTRSDVEDPSRLARAGIVEPLPASRSGYLAALDALEIGQAAVELGGGRAHKGDPVDHAVGIVLRARVGDWVEAGQPLLDIHATDPSHLPAVRHRLLAACQLAADPTSPPPLVHHVIRPADPMVVSS